MIAKFGPDTALLVVDAQKGVNDLTHWGGANARRNNPDAERHIIRLIDEFRAHGLPVVFTVHDSCQEISPLKLGTPGGEFLDGIEPRPGEPVISKDVNSGFVGTSLEVQLRRRAIRRLVTVGYFTNFCVESSVRMAANMGYDSYLLPDACATTNRVGFDGVDYDPELIHSITVASLNGEFATALTIDDALDLLDADSNVLMRRQGNE